MNRTLSCAFALLLAGSYACGDDGAPAGTADIGGDTSTDATSDAANADAGDATADGGEDAPSEDATPDTPPTDTGAGDSGGEDAAADATVDTGTDAAPDVVEPDSGVPVTCETHTPWRRGPLRVTRSTITLPRSTAGTFEAEVFVPAEATEALPLVIFNHGFQLTAAEFTTYGEWLASHGFVAVLPTIGDNLISARTHAELGADAIAWLDHLLSTSDGYDGGYLDGAIGIAGHSRGGKQSLLAAADDARFAAVFGVDPVDAGPPFGSNPTDFPSVTPERMDDLDRPLGLVGAGLAGESGIFGPACAPTDDNYQRYFDAAPGPAWAWTLPDAGHLDFLDACSNPLVCATCAAGDDPGAARDFARATMVAFFRSHLLDDTTCDAWLDGDRVTGDATLTVTVQTR